MTGKRINAGTASPIILALSRIDRIFAALSLQDRKTAMNFIMSQHLAAVDQTPVARSMHVQYGDFEGEENGI